MSLELYLAIFGLIVAIAGLGFTVAQMFFIRKKSTNSTIVKNAKSQENLCEYDELIIRHKRRVQK